MGMILLVGNDNNVLNALSRMIRSAGYRVTAINSPVEAIARAADMKSVELLISEICMREMDGLELYRQLRIQLPKLRSLFLSGFLEPASLPKFDPKLSILKKPIEETDLSDNIAAILSQPPAIRGSK